MRAKPNLNELLVLGPENVVRTIFGSARSREISGGGRLLHIRQETQLLGFDLRGCRVYFAPGWERLDWIRKAEIDNGQYLAIVHGMPRIPIMLPTPTARSVEQAPSDESARALLKEHRDLMHPERAKMWVAARWSDMSLSGLYFVASVVPPEELRDYLNDQPHFAFNVVVSCIDNARSDSFLFFLSLGVNFDAETMRLAARSVQKDLPQSVALSVYNAWTAAGYAPHRDVEKALWPKK